MAWRKRTGRVIMLSLHEARDGNDWVDVTIQTPRWYGLTGPVPLADAPRIGEEATVVVWFPVAVTCAVPETRATMTVRRTTAT